MTSQLGQTMSLRRATSADSTAIDRLATLDSQSRLTGDGPLAEVEGELWAAVEFDTGRAVADPFQPSGPAVRLARERAEQLRGSVYRARRRRYRGLPRIRFA